MVESAERLTPEELRERVARAVRRLSTCRACPRECDADRAADETGFCQTGRLARVCSGAM